MSGPWDDFKPAGDSGPWDDFAAPSQQKPKPKGSAPSGFAMGLADPVHGGAQLLTKLLPQGVVQAGDRLNNWLADKTGLVARLPEGGVDQQVREREATYTSARAAAGQDGIDWARVLGNIVNPANLALASRLPAAASLGGRVVAGAAGGGVSSALAPVGQGDFAEEKLKQAATGAAFGGAVPAIGQGVARAISPRASVNPDLALLRAEGVRPTIGQALGGRWNAAEEKLQSLPVLGDAIANARKQGMQQFNSAAINRATAPVGSKVQGTGQEAVGEAAGVLSKAYDDALSTLKHVRFDGQFTRDASQLRQMAQSLTPQMREQFNRTMQDIVGGRVSTSGVMLADTYKKVESEVGKKAARYSGSSVASEQELGDALKQLQALLRDQVGRANPQAADALKAANSGYANLVRVEGAAKAAKNNGGVFTPAQLNTAIQQADRSVRKRSVAHGNALMQDLGSAGQNVLGNRVPDSGTAGRLALGGGAAAGAYFADPALAALLLGSAGLYTSLPQRMGVWALSARPQAAQQVAPMLQQAAPMFAPAGGLLGLQLANQ